MASSSSSSSNKNNNNNNNNMDSLNDGRSLFKRLIINTARAPYRVVKMISLWLSNFAPQSSFIHQILSMSDPEIDSVPVEAELILDSLLPGRSSSNDDNDVPITTGLLNMSMNTQYFIINRDSVFEGMSDILSSLRSMVSEDLATWMNGGLNVSYRVGGLQIKANNEAGSSDGISFTKEELREFFIRRYAAIEWVIFPNTPPNSSPKLARIVFFTPMALDMVLGNSNLLELEIEGKCLWARRFRWVDMRA
ncbi:hypothetical protein QJS10_CPB18g00443 [Acorus calamus]|uniref:Uncharacterized protein n=1 Tax=Acorus calamus TaxID=4465 RepID=A0AAV9CQ53_ACOCL|nr:hypothetical protein QJS10_CPB18g00443 [Acorus calamus]